jgi:hypothetical protein
MKTKCMPAALGMYNVRTKFSTKKVNFLVFPGKFANLAVKVTVHAVHASELSVSRVEYGYARFIILLVRMLFR